RVHAEIAIATQQGRLRTTLDRMKLRMPAAALPDGGEYRRLVASDRYLASVLRHAHDAIVSLDPDGFPASWNRGAELLFGLNFEQVRRVPFASLFRNTDAAESALGAALSGSFCMIGLEVARGDDARYLDANFGALRDDGQAVIGAVAILRDITERHRAEEELRATSRHKDEFLAMLAHELRNPLAPIRSAAQILGMLPHPDPRGMHAIEIIGRQAEHMTGLIDDLLDVARVTRGTFALDREILAIGEVVHDAVEQARTLIEARHHALHIELPLTELHVRGDRKRLTQVVANLLVNAAKYTPDGGSITLSVAGDDRHVDLAVVDTGIGMSPELVDRAFELFVQAERSPDRAEGGLGIGLSLVRSLVAMHGGQVAARSEG
ncbi:PAS domain-containing sensor histidine kinase, partial [Cognatilysobacter lacus]